MPNYVKDNIPPPPTITEEDKIPVMDILNLDKAR